MMAVRVCTGDELEKLVRRRRRPVLVHFSSPLTPTSREIREDLAAMCRVFARSLEFREVSVPTADHGDIERFEIERLPSLVVFHRGEIVERFEQRLPAEELAHLLHATAAFYTD